MATLIGRSLAFTALVWLALSTQAQAGPKEEAEAYATLARSAFEAGKYATCAAHFRASYDLVPNPNHLFNVGLCHEKDDDIVKALAAFREYLQVAPNGDRAAEATTRAELIALKLESQAKEPSPVVTETQDVEPSEAPTATTPAGTSPEESGPENRAIAAPPAPAYVPPLVAKRSKVYSLDERIFLQMPLGLIWIQPDTDDGGPGVSLGFAAHLLGTGGTGLVLRIRTAYGKISDHFVNASFGPGLVLGSPDLNFFVAPGLGLMLDDSAINFDLNAVAGMNKRLAGKFDLEITYTRHLPHHLDDIEDASINVFSVAIGRRFAPN